MPVALRGRWKAPCARLPSAGRASLRSSLLPLTASRTPLATPATTSTALLSCQLRTPRAGAAAIPGKDCLGAPMLLSKTQAQVPAGTRVGTFSPLLHSGGAGQPASSRLRYVAPSSVLRMGIQAGSPPAPGRDQSLHPGPGVVLLKGTPIQRPNPAFKVDVQAIQIEVFTLIFSIKNISLFKRRIRSNR